MQTIQSINYSIHIGNESLLLIDSFITKNKYSKYLVLCDENTLKNCWPLLLENCKSIVNAEVIEIESGEQSKSIEIAMQLWQSFIDGKYDKKTLLINLGGGVISDLGGFVASVYKRGIDFINVPTSLLAMADASVGGKTGIDFSGIKNVIGTITQPKAVFVNVGFLNTLPNNHLKNGLAEVFKIALVADALFWKKISTQTQHLSLDEVITKSIKLKNTIVKKDPLENNIRKALNFGHTVGHALEATLLGTKQELLHGEAIVIGMIAEAWLSYTKKLITKKELDEIVSVLITLFKPSGIHKNKTETIISFMQQDKKNKNGNINCALINGIGNFKLDVNVTITQIEKALLFYNQQIISLKT